MTTTTTIILSDGLADVPAELLKWLIIVLLAGLNVYTGFFKKPAAVPQPFEVRKGSEYASADGVRALAVRVDKLEECLQDWRVEVTKEMHDTGREILQAGEQRAIAIHGRIEPLSTCIHDVAGELKQLTLLVHQLNSSVGRGYRKT